MKREAPPESLEASQELHSLITTLHETGRRLEEITAGEVDTVADPEGHAFLLGGPQETLRRIQQAKEVALLNALPASVALLDVEGRIQSVNDAWRQFAPEAGLHAAGGGVGLNYLEICDREKGERIAEGALIGDGIRSVLDRRAPSFSIEYELPSPDVRRWIRTTATPLFAKGPTGAVIMHVDVTAGRQTEISLQISESRFRQMAENISDVFFLQSLDASEIYYVSPAYERIWGRTCASLYARPISWIEAFHPEDVRLAKVQLEDSSGLANLAFDYEFRILHPETGIRWIHVRGFPVLDGYGNPYRTAGIASDITEQKRIETNIKRLSRVHAIVSGISALIVRTRDRDELFKEACRITVEIGAFQMAWIGTIDVKTGEGRVVASHGADEGYLDQIRITANDDLPHSGRPASRALRTAKAVVCNDIATDPSIGPLRADLLLHDYKAVACLPISIGGRPSAVLCLFASETDVFDEKEMRLLASLAGDLSFALDHLEGRERLNYLALYDEATGLANRTLFLDRLGQRMQTAATTGHTLALFLFDIERFKNINDTLGRAAGDDLLRQAAQWMILTAGDATLLARVGADHFAAILPEVKGDDVSRLVTSTLEAFVGHAFRLGDTVLRASVKIGIALAPVDGDDAEALFRNAEAALKKAKAHGDRYLFYTPTMTEAAAGQLTLENQLRQALKRGEFVLHYQPKISLTSGKITGAEALIRWNDPRTGLVSPSAFIPILEQTGLILEVGRWGLAQAIEDHRRWRSEGLPGAIRVAVNVSPRQLKDPHFVSEIRQLLGGHPHVGHGLELEITESVIMEDVKNTIATLQAIREMGISVAIDDFGTGFSSLSYLSKLPVDTLKIDRSFVVDMTAGPEGLSLVSTIINLAHSMKLNVVAEGVETEEQSRLLRLLNCDEIQGFLFSRPLPCREFESTHLAGL